MPSNGKWLRTSFFLLLIALAIVLVVFIFRSPSDTKEVSITTLLTDIKTDMNHGRQDTLTVSNDHITLTRGGPDTPEEVTNINDTFDITKVLKDNGIDYTNHLLVLQYEPPSALAAWVSVLISFIPFILIGGLLIFMMRQAQGSNNQALSFGKGRGRMFMGNKPSVTFADVAGVEEAKQELEEIGEFLKYPEKFVALGARIPKGLLLVGPPGTGKTLISRAVAGEAGVPFFSISGSEFVEMFVGVGASRVRDLFDQAKRTPGFSGADLSNLLNEAAILGARRNKRSIGMSELEEAIDRVVAGPARKSRIISEREKAITAYHEVGHALVARMLPNTDPVHKVSIVARGQAGGFTMLLPTEDRYLWSKPQFEDMLAYALGGHVAEMIIFGEVTTGASNDIERVTKIARSMVT